MTRDEAIERLPEIYATALRLADAGVDRAAIARQLGIVDVETLIEIAERKLARLLRTSRGPS